MKVRDTEPMDVIPSSFVSNEYESNCGSQSQPLEPEEHIMKLGSTKRSQSQPALHDYTGQHHADLIPFKTSDTLGYPPPKRIDRHHKIREERKKMLRNSMKRTIPDYMTLDLENSQLGIKNRKVSNLVATVESLRSELRVANNGVELLSSLVDDNILWVHQNCNTSKLHHTLSNRSKEKCRKIATDRLFSAMESFQINSLAWVFNRWRQANLISNYMNISCRYAKGKGMNLLLSKLFNTVYVQLQLGWRAFMRNMTKQRRWEMDTAAIELQRVARGFIDRRAFKKIMSVQAAIIIQKVYRIRLARDELKRRRQEYLLLKMNQASQALKEFFRGLVLVRKAKEELLHLRYAKAASTIQALTRGVLSRIHFVTFREEVLRERRIKAEKQKKLAEKEELRKMVELKYRQEQEEKLRIEREKRKIAKARQQQEKDKQRKDRDRRHRDSERRRKMKAGKIGSKPTTTKRSELMNRLFSTDHNDDDSTGGGSADSSTTGKDRHRSSDTYAAARPSKSLESGTSDTDDRDIQENEQQDRIESMRMKRLQSKSSARSFEGSTGVKDLSGEFYDDVELKAAITIQSFARQNQAKKVVSGMKTNDSVSFRKKIRDDDEEEEEEDLNAVAVVNLSNAKYDIHGRKEDILAEYGTSVESHPVTADSDVDDAAVQAAIKVQSIARQKSARILADEMRKKKIVETDDDNRDRVEEPIREDDAQESVAAITLQSFARQISAKRLVEHMKIDSKSPASEAIMDDDESDIKESAALKLQSLARQRSAARLVEDMRLQREKEIQAAVKLQSLSRQRSAVKLADSMREAQLGKQLLESNSETVENKETLAAIKLQSLARQKSAMRMVEDIKRSVVVTSIASNDQKDFDIEVDQDTQINAAIKLQSLARQRSAVRMVDEMKRTDQMQCGTDDQHQIEAAIKIQSLARQKSAMKMLTQLKQENEKTDVISLPDDESASASKASPDIDTMKVIIIQKYIRKFLTKRKVAILRSIKMEEQRKAGMIVLWAVLSLQRVARGRHGRLRFAVIYCQFYFIIIINLKTIGGEKNA
jgi:hypothetical protein